MHGKSVHFIESPSKNQKFSKANMKSTICHVFQRKGPKDEHNAHWWSCVGWRKQSHVIHWQYWILQSFMMVCLIFHTTIIINRKNWGINVKLHFENLSIFFSECTHMLEPPSSSLASVRFCSLFNDPPPSPPPPSTNVPFECPRLAISFNCWRLFFLSRLPFLHNSNLCLFFSPIWSRFK